MQTNPHRGGKLASKKSRQELKIEDARLIDAGVFGQIEDAFDYMYLGLNNLADFNS